MSPSNRVSPVGLCGDRSSVSGRWHGGHSAFVLFEAMLAVAIFSLGVLALAHCMQNCLQAEMMKEEDVRLRRLLENRMIEIEAGAVPLSDVSTDTLKGAFEGISLKTTRTPLKLRNEKDQEITGLFSIKLEATWTTGGQKLERSLDFYLFPRTAQ